MKAANITQKLNLLYDIEMLFKYTAMASSCSLFYRPLYESLWAKIYLVWANNMKRVRRGYEVQQIYPLESFGWNEQKKCSYYGAPLRKKWFVL